ncbi:epoxide hydrolase 4 [Rhinichthys klamathensis goyatoka]|uniref:epoxide hydrolase 4 n=1 Tax=Rhinichthys klamathensis goyatoka TaxID=3034132 RepID=UPI0024B51E56|nr:epoxide hydrolase 4 [Rhinichthys klamathensis goyatoka]
MARLLHNLLLLTVALTLKIRVMGYWSLIYGYCALCTGVALLKLGWNIILRPSTTFQWTVRETPPACLNDTSLGTHCYVRIKESGLRFHYVAAGERGKPLMLFLHGFPEFWFSWRHQLREFKSEFRVVAVDMRGYGESDLPSSAESYRLDYLVTDIKDIVEYLGYNRCFLVGHDWGGIIAWLCAIHYPEMVTKLIVLNSPHPCVFTDYALRHPSQMLKSSYYFFFQLPHFPELMLSINDFKALKNLFTSRSTGISCKGRWLTTEDLEAYLYALSQPGALTGALNYFRNVFSVLPLNQSEVKSPVLLLWGERDAFLEQDMAEACRLYIRNHFRLNIISGASHWLQQDQPDIVNTLIWTFIKEGEGRKNYRNL